MYIPHDIITKKIGSNKDKLKWTEYNRHNLITLLRI